ncbi:hypothetical protein BSKO_07138 [Bryopsis sp. KO-2023]|nr:hypothetical protein BSKO_07138 [Bryopsis sp. KO-2023]
MQGIGVPPSTKAPRAARDKILQYLRIPFGSFGRPKMSCLRMKRGQVREERSVYSGDDYDKSMDLITQAMACKSDALNNAQQQLNFAVQEIECLRSELAKERAARSGLEKDVQILGRAVQEHCVTLCEYFLGKGDLDALEGLKNVKKRNERPETRKESSLSEHDSGDILTLTNGVWNQLSPEGISAIKGGKPEEEDGGALSPEQLEESVSSEGHIPCSGT